MGPTVPRKRRKKRQRERRTGINRSKRVYRGGEVTSPSLSLPFPFGTKLTATRQAKGREAAAVPPPPPKLSCQPGKGEEGGRTLSHFGTNCMGRLEVLLLYLQLFQPASASASPLPSHAGERVPLPPPPFLQVPPHPQANNSQPCRRRWKSCCSPPNSSVRSISPPSSAFAAALLLLLLSKSHSVPLSLRPLPAPVPLLFPGLLSVPAPPPLLLRLPSVGDRDPRGSETEESHLRTHTKYSHYSRARCSVAHSFILCVSTYSVRKVGISIAAPSFR